MRCRWLGWAGIELEYDGARIVIDALGDPRAVYQAVGGMAAHAKIPNVVEPKSTPVAVAGLLTHLHRDHADAGALVRTLGKSGSVYMPAPDRVDNAANANVKHATEELDASGLKLIEVVEWQPLQLGPFKATPVPAVDGGGDPQVSWAVEAGGKRILHCGDTMFHGLWWRAVMRAGPFDAAFLPINGAIVDFRWRQPSSLMEAVMTPEQAVGAGRALNAGVTIPIHFDGFELDPHYRSVPNALERFSAAARERGIKTRPLQVGESIDI
jgi:L-ascorbate metabolism protein UlaG (beta-lactamase superfamily)